MTIMLESVEQFHPTMVAHWHKHLEDAADIVAAAAIVSLVLLMVTDLTIADGLFGRLETQLLRRTPRKIDQPISIVSELEQIADPRRSVINTEMRRLKI
jgi:hypothetical protein